jgi:hypothetical protein
MRYTQRSHALGNIKTWISKHGKQDNINKPKKPGSIEGSPYT